MQPDPWKIVAGLAAISAISAIMFKVQAPLRDGKWHRSGSQMRRFADGRWEYRPKTAAEITEPAARE